MLARAHWEAGLLKCSCGHPLLAVPEGEFADWGIYFACGNCYRVYSLKICDRKVRPDQFYEPLNTVVADDP